MQPESLARRLATTSGRLPDLRFLERAFLLLNCDRQDNVIVGSLSFSDCRRPLSGRVIQADM